MQAWAPKLMPSTERSRGFCTLSRKQAFATRRAGGANLIGQPRNAESAARRRSNEVIPNPRRQISRRADLVVPGSVADPTAPMSRYSDEVRHARASTIFYEESLNNYTEFRKCLPLRRNRKPFGRDCNYPIMRFPSWTSGAKETALFTRYFLPPTEGEAL